jgi:hypothetical protein
MDFDEETLTVRRNIKAPEIDEYDVISRQIDDISIGDKIRYSL